jgi:glutaredoxin
LDRFDTEKDRNLQKSSDMDVVVVSIVGCAYCRRVKDALERHNIRYKDIDLTYRGDLLDTVKGMTGKRTVPMVFVNGRLVGGASEVMELVAESPDGTGLLLEDGVQYDLDALLSSASSDSGHGGESQSTSLVATVRRLKEIRDAYRNQNSTIENVSDILDSDVVRDMFKYHILVEEGGGLEWSDAIPIVSGTVDRRPLNTHIKPHKREKKVQSAVEMSETLRVLLLELFDEYMTSDGRLVDYTGMRLDDKFRIYVDATVDLQAVDLGGMSMQEAMCFWINMYNSLIVHAVCVFGPATSTLERLTWFDKVSYNIGGHRFSANDIEHGILRSNAPSPASLWSILGISRLAKPIFANEKDPRVQYIMPKVDPRIHFALNCGARSCPPIKVFSVDSLNDGLEAATEAFCEGEVRFDENTRELYLSSIFKWYASDFGATKEERVQFILPHLSDEKTRQALQKCLDKGEPIQFRYLPYDWSINST